MNNGDGRMSERLDAAMAALRKATPGELFILWLRNGSVKYPVATTKDRNIFIEPTSQQKAEDCRAIIAAVNLLRQHGPALADLARRWEGSVVGTVDRVGSDEEGDPRILVHSTIDELHRGAPLPYRKVRIVPDMGEGE